MSVLVGVDGSAGGVAALRWADAWAAAGGDRLIAATSWQYPRTAALPGGPTLGPPEAMDEAAGADLRSTVADALGEGGEHVATAVERGPAAWALLELAHREHASLLVVGRRGLGSLEGRLLGSVSRRVAELAPCPVAIVPPEWHGGGPIVVGVDGSPGAAHALDWAIRAAEVRGVGIVLVHGLAGVPAEVGRSAVERFVEQARTLVDRHAHRVSGAGVDVVKVVRVDDPRSLIPLVADQYDASLVVVGGEGDGPVSGMLIGSVVNHIAQQSEHPVVIVPEPRH